MEIEDKEQATEIEETPIQFGKINSIINFFFTFPNNTII